MAFNEDKPHGTITGQAGVKYVQDGKYYTADKREIKNPFPANVPVKKETK